MSAAPSGGFGGRTLLAVGSITVGAFAGVTTEFLPVGLLGDIGRDLHVSDGTAGLMITVPALVAALAAPIVTVAAGRVDRRLVVFALTSVLVVSNVLAAIAPSFATMLVARALLGVNVGGFWAIGPSLGVRLARGAGVGRATAMILAGISLGTVLGVPLGTLVGAAAGWRVAFAATAVLSAGVLVLQTRALPPLPAAARVRARQLTHLLRARAARVGLLATVTLVAGHFLAYTYINPFLEDESGIDPGALSAVLLVFGAAGLAGNWAAGIAVERHLRTTLIAVTSLLTATLVLLPVVGTNAPGAAALVAVWGFAFSGVPLGLQVWMFRASPDAPEGGAALFVSLFQLCLALGALLGGRVVDAFGVSDTMLLAGAITALTAVPLVVGGRAPSAATTLADSHAEQMATP